MTIIQIAILPKIGQKFLNSFVLQFYEGGKESLIAAIIFFRLLKIIRSKTSTSKIKICLEKKPTRAKMFY